MPLKRRKARVIHIGSVSVGAGFPVAIQSMAKEKTSRVDKVVSQIRTLEGCGCEIVRVAIKDAEDALAIRAIKRAIRMPLVADIHFDYKLALKAIDSGADKIRLNPGNIYKKEEVRQVVSALKQAGIPLRVGVNSGSIRGGVLKRVPLARQLVKSCLDYLRLIESLKFYDIVVSLKGSSVMDTVDACRLIAGRCDYPLHLGVTATGAPYGGAIKSAVALGALLMEGIGDTVRVSLTDTPEQEIKAARAILEALGLRSFGPEVISCPTCGRCEVDLIKIVRELEEQLALINGRSLKHKKIAVMGCVVNGPGEARGADIGVAFGKDKALLFKAGKPVRKIGAEDCIGVLMKELER